MSIKKMIEDTNSYQTKEENKLFAQYCDLILNDRHVVS